MKYVCFDAGPWPRFGRFGRCIIAIITTVIPKGNPDFEDAYARTVHWWLEVDPEGQTQREIAFDAAGNIVAIGPIGDNVGIFTDIDSCPDGVYGQLDAERFEAAWESFAQGRE